MLFTRQGTAAVGAIAGRFFRPLDRPSTGPCLGLLARVVNRTILRGDLRPIDRRPDSNFSASRIASLICVRVLSSTLGALG